MEIRRVEVVDVLIGLVALVPWRTALFVALQLSIFVRTFDAYLKWALPILFIAGPLLAYCKERRQAAVARRMDVGCERMDELADHVPAR